MGMPIRHIDEDAKMIADIRVLHSKVQDLHSGVIALRERYADQDLTRYAEVGQVRGDAEMLRQISAWLGIITDALNDRESTKQRGG
jgi:hypothetical protein